MNYNVAPWLRKGENVKHFNPAEVKEVSAVFS